MYVMEPADENNKDHSHVAYKMKQKPMVFEDSNGIVFITGFVQILPLTVCVIVQLFLALLTKLRMDGQIIFGRLCTTNADWVTNCLDLFSGNVYLMENGVETHQSAFVKYSYMLILQKSPLIMKHTLIMCQHYSPLQHQSRN